MKRKALKYLPARSAPGRALLLLLFAALLASSVSLSTIYAQQTMTSATLTGRVEDASGAIVSGATVAVTSLDTNQTQTALSDEEGRYRFAYLPAGSYRLMVEHAGFTPLQRELTLTLGQALDVPLKLSVEGVTGSVQITADVPLIEAARTQVAETVLPREIDALPLNGRNYLDLALLVPAVSRTNTGSNQRFAETSAVPGTGLSVAGQRNLNNGFVIDGLSANDDAADLAGTFYSQEVIREFQVVTSGGIAEFGRASSGVVNIITQTGTNQWRGRLYGYFRNQRFDARNALAPRKDLLTQTQYGVSLGGPLRRDRTFLFSNFEQTRRNDSNVITITSANVAAINNRLNQTNYRGGRIETGVVPGGFDATNLFARVDHKFDANNLLSLRYSIYDIVAANSRNVGGLNSVSRGTSLIDRDQTFAAGNVTTLSPRSINEARFQLTRSRLAAPVNDSVGPAVNISGVASFGTATFSPIARSIDLYEAVDNITMQSGSHSLKAGADVLYNRVQIEFPGAVQGVYTFTTLQNFLSGAYSSFQQAFGAPTQFQSNPNLGLFIQDEWRPLHSLTVNAGLRYDAQFLPAPIETDTNNVAPRIGFAYSPGDRKTVVRASFGIYFDRIPLRAVSNALQRDGSKYIVAQLSPTQAGAPVFPNALAAQPSTLLTRPNITRIDPGIESSYSEQINVQVERELPWESSLSVGYIHLRGAHLILSRNVNVPRFPASAGVPNLGRPDPNFGNISRFESSGDAYYNALVLAFNKRASRLLNMRVSYTLSKAIDDAGNFFFSTPQDNFNVRGDLGRSDNDQRHRLTFSGSLDAPPSNIGASFFRRALDGFQLSYIFSYASSLPFNPLTGNDRNFDTNFNDRPTGMARNSGRGFDSASLDLRLSRKFRITERVGLEAIMEGFNVLNRSNFQIPNNTFGTGQTPLATYGTPTAASDPRQLQVGLRISF
ncbi:MAG TPA: carboxypeptidase regulatory-like domain-containing protein [Pyrinomonadaceae bacterium]|nr:carboxypeptidase regulatory-like domain-containing protein [Pyrinomonadaceae bacterium]